MDETSVAKVNAAMIDMAASTGIEKEQISPTQLPAGQPGTEAGLCHGGAGDREAVCPEYIVDKPRTVKSVGSGFTVGVATADFCLCEGDELVNTGVVRCGCFLTAALFGRFARTGCRCGDWVSGGEDQAVAFAGEVERAAGIVGDDKCQASGISLEVGDMEGAGIGCPSLHAEG